jgi:TrkA domain protein
MDVHRTVLPGIGLRHEFVTERGRRVGVVSHRTGRRQVVVYDRADPDTAAVTLTLNVEEANGLAELLASTRVVERARRAAPPGGGAGLRADPDGRWFPLRGADSR